MFEHVKMLTTDALGHKFWIAGQVVFVGRGVPLTGTTVGVTGEVGRLVLPRWFVEQERIDGGSVLH